MSNHSAFAKLVAQYLIPLLLIPWVSVQAEVPILPEAEDCITKIKQAATVVKGNADSAGIFRYSAAVPNFMPDAKYPISFEREVIGRSPSGYCMELEIRPVFKTWWSRVPIIGRWWGKVPIEVGPDHDKRTSFRAYLLFDDPEVADDISADHIKAFGYRISSDEGKKDDYRGESISGFLSEMVIVVKVGNKSYFGASGKQLADDPKATAHLRDWHVGTGDPDLDEAFVVLCNRDCKEQAGYVPGRQEVITPVRSKVIVSPEDVKIRITLANGDPLPPDCAPVLDYYEPATNRPAGSFRLVGQDILEIDQSGTRIERLDAHGRLALRFEEGSCGLDEEAAKKRRIKPLLQGKRIRIEERAYLTKPTLHVVFAFDKRTTGKVIEKDFTADVIKQIIDGLDQATNTAGFHRVELYAHFQDDDRKRQRPFQAWAAGGFPSATGIEKLARKPLAESGPSESRDLTDKRVERFIRLITDGGSRPFSADHKAVFLFVGRHELNPAAICKSTRGDLARIEERLEATSAKAVLIDFYKSPHALVDALSPDFPRLEPLGEKYGKFPLFRCIDQEPGHRRVESDVGRLSQIIVDWGAKITTSWRHDLTRAIRGLQKEGGPLRP